MLPVEHLQPVERAPTPRVLAPPAAPNGDSGTQSDAHCIYQTLGVHGGPSEAPQRGLYRSIGDETLSPVEHLQQALELRLRGARGSVEIPPYVCEAIRASTDMGVPALQAHRRREIRRWGEIAASLPRRHDEPFHAALVEVMDHELDLLARGPSRFTQVADPIRVARQGAAVVGVVEYPHVFGAHPKPPGPPAPLHALYAMQAGVHARVLGKVAWTSKSDRKSCGRPWKRRWSKALVGCMWDTRLSRSVRSCTTTGSSPIRNDGTNRPGRPSPGRVMMRRTME